jgi:hypothetical protein
LRLVQPAHGAVVTRRRPTVRWRSAVGSPGWLVEFCADARCERVLQRESTAGWTVAPSADLPTGLVFWRVSDPTRLGVRSAARWFHVPQGAPAGAAPGGGSVASLGQFDADCDGRAELLGVDGTLRGMDATGAGVARIARDGVESMIAAGDVDGDGCPDLAGLTDMDAPDGPSLVVWRGPVRGDAVAPSWRLLIPEDLPDAGRSAFALLAGDFNGDGYRDLVVTSPLYQDRRGRIYLVPGGAGKPAQDAVLALESPRGIGSRFQALAAADLDGDGCDDLLASAPGNRGAGLTSVYRGTPQGLDALPVWSIARAATQGDGLGAAGAIADVTGDGELDVALAATEARARGCVYVHPWRTDARSPAAQPSSASCGSSDGAYPSTGGHVALGDYDGDGHADLVVTETNADTTHLIWTTPGGREGLYEGGLTALSGAGSSALLVRRLITTELDGDGRSDLLVQTINSGAPDAYVRFQGTPAGLRPWPPP